jgi:gamma-glutamylcyclotransferase (GGCT)/AIG2-like uncharacterized protein YtfP
MSERRIRYFAYGSNLSAEQMRTRCPSARREAKAWLRGHRLVFGGFSHGWQGGVAHVVRDPKSAVPGLVYSLSTEDLATLDRYEGFPHAYDRVQRIVAVRGGARVRAHVYLLADVDELELARPGVSYLCVLWLAYKRLGFNRTRLARAAGLVE